MEFSATRKARLFRITFIYYTSSKVVSSHSVYSSDTVQNVGRCWFNFNVSIIENKKITRRYYRRNLVYLKEILTRNDNKLYRFSELISSTTLRTFQVFILQGSNMTWETMAWFVTDIVSNPNDFPLP